MPISASLVAFLTNVRAHRWPLAAAVALAALAWASNKMLGAADLSAPGSSVIALVAGMVISLGLGRTLSAGTVLTGTVLPIAIVLLGFGLDLRILGEGGIGIAGAGALAATAVTAFAVSVGAGRALGLSMPEAFALGAGGAVCGNSAVAAVSPALGLPGPRMGLVLAVINLLGLLTVLLVPLLARVLGLDASQAGLWAGASVHAVPQALAAGEAIGPEGLVLATAVKLSRVSLLVVVVPLAAVVGARLRAGDAAAPMRRSPLRGVPWFVPGFVAATLLGSYLLPSGATGALDEVGRLLMLPVLAGVGLAVKRAGLLSVGGSLALTGLIATVALMAVSLAAILTLAG
ncbi:MAG: putative sulfate exporter family transporter [Chloroflexota bacterium]